MPILMQIINDYRAFILPVMIIVEVLALVIVLRMLWQGFKEDFDL